MRVLDQSLAAFLQGPVMMVFAAKDADGWPAVGRAVGARPSPDLAAVDIFVPAHQWGPALSGVVPGAPIALTFVQPADYRAFQVKGPALSLNPATPADLAMARGYVAAMKALLGGLGVPPDQSPHWLSVDDLMTLRMAPRTAFAQTPGAGAGEAVAGGVT